MQDIQSELGRARQRLTEAGNPHAKAMIAGIVMALEWALEPPGRTSPSEVALAAKADPPHKKPAKKKAK